MIVVNREFRRCSLVPRLIRRRLTVCLLMILKLRSVFGPIRRFIEKRVVLWWNTRILNLGRFVLILFLRVPRKLFVVPVLLKLLLISRELRRTMKVLLMNKFVPLFRLFGLFVLLIVKILLESGLLLPVIVFMLLLRLKPRCEKRALKLLRWVFIVNMTLIGLLSRRVIIVMKPRLVKITELLLTVLFSLNLLLLPVFKRNVMRVNGRTPFVVRPWFLLILKILWRVTGSLLVMKGLIKPRTRLIIFLFLVRKIIRQSLLVVMILRKRLLLFLLLVTNRVGALTVRLNRKKLLAPRVVRRNVILKNLFESRVLVKPLLKPLTLLRRSRGSRGRSGPGCIAEVVACSHWEKSNPHRGPLRNCSI